jgi:hypothetical protein
MSRLINSHDQQSSCALLLRVNFPSHQFSLWGEIFATYIFGQDSIALGRIGQRILG